MEPKNTSTIKYKSTGKRISEAEKTQLIALIADSDVVSAEVVATIVPNAYKYRCFCQALGYSRATGEFALYDTSAKTGRRGQGTRWTIRVSSADAANRYKAAGWKLIRKSNWTLVA